MDTVPIFPPGSRAAQCPDGHPWGPRKVLVGWQPCGECDAGRGNFNGHHTLRCGTCRWRWYWPAHDGQDWVRV